MFSPAKFRADATTRRREIQLVSVRVLNVLAMGVRPTEQLSLPGFEPLARTCGRYRPGDAADCDAAADVSLRQTTFVVVDLETTGPRTAGATGTAADAITEIGAVKVRGGAVFG